MSVEVVSYSPNAQQLLFHRSTAKFRCYLGAVRAGKTLAGCWEGIDQSMQYPRNEGLITRKTYRELKDTTQKTFFEQCPKHLIKDWQKSDQRLILKNDSAIIFRSLDSLDKVKSLELGWWYIDEGTEVEEEYPKMLESRLSLKHIPPQGRRGWITTNPPNIDHWIYKDYVTRKDDRYELIRANTYTNKANLPEGYIENLEKSYDPNWVRKYLSGEFGYDLKGKPVFYGFKSDIHRAKLNVNPNKPIVRGWDFGFHHPCVVFSQMDGDGRWNIHKCVLGTDIYIQDFAPVVIQLSSTWFPNQTFRDVGDPAGAFKKDSTISTIRILKEQYGIVVEYIPSKVKPGVDIINQKLNTLIGGKPALMVSDDETCNIVAEILQGAYFYQEMSEEPYKDGYYEHPADALRYTAVNLLVNRPNRNFSIPVGRPTYATGVSVRG